jgi:hypothetical protein
LACTGSGGTATGTATLTVATAVVPPPKSGGGGGGAVGLWELLGLSTLGILARRRNRIGARVAGSR